jgi:hypothetical protein
MTDFDRNVRTLIVCFVVAVVFLVPLVVLETKTEMSRETKVLGVLEVNEKVPTVKEAANEIILPDAGSLE